MVSEESSSTAALSEVSGILNTSFGVGPPRLLPL